MMIRDVAHATGVPPSTLRFYEKTGVLPEPPRTAAGLRNYTDDHVAYVLFIAELKATGMSNGEIVEYIADGYGCPVSAAASDRPNAEIAATRIAILAQHRKRLVDQVSNLQRLIGMTDMRITHLEKCQTSSRITGGRARSRATKRLRAGLARSAR